MKSVLLKFKPPRQTGYEILIQNGLLSRLGREIKRRFPSRTPFVISSAPIRQAWGKALDASLGRVGLKAGWHLVPDGEKNKNFREFERGLAALSAFGKGEATKPLVLLLGGGVVGDLGGFVAACYRRGVPFVQIPSTLLSMVDSSVGGKLGIDFQTPRGLIKNLVGTFSQPSWVAIDPTLLETLPPRQLVSGFAEAVKVAVLFDKALFDVMENSVSRLLALDPSALLHVIHACVAHKARVVMQDEYDTRGRRVLLNLGHTFGHAIEAASHFQMLHGECVAFGMCCAVDLSAQKGLADPELMRVPALLEHFGLPVRLPLRPLGPVMQALSEDKKFEGNMRFVVPQRLGRSCVVTVRDSEVIKRIFKGRFDAATGSRSRR